MVCHSEQKWENVIEQQPFTDVLQNRCSENFANFAGKPVLESLFKKVAGLRPCNVTKKRLQHRCFPVKFAKFLRTTLFTEHPRWLLLVIISLTPGSLP